MKVGLFFGSFNPVHIGHMAIANYMVEYTDMQALWFVISPHNPLKKKSSLLSDNFRLELLNLAVDNDPRFIISDVEFRMPQPSYTIDTLAYLRDKYPSYQFSLIMGSDSLTSFSKWKNYQLIIAEYTRYIYPRPGINNIDLSQHQNIKLVDAPMMEISSSFIRSALKNGKNMRYFLPDNVYEKILSNKFYM